MLPPMKSPKTELGAGGSGWVSDPWHRALWPPGPVGEGLGRDAEAQGSRRAGAAPAPQSRARSLPDGFTKPVGPAGPREGGRASAEGGDAHRSLPPPRSSSTMNPSQLLSGLEDAPGRCPSVGLRQEVSVHPGWQCLHPAPVTHRTSCPHLRG